ncbi:MAG: FkbM family methyltransferase [Chthoniobacterales bacterium]
MNMNIIRSILAQKFRISYSQLAEDIIISEIFSRRRNITYIDIGANHPIFGSNSFYFYLRGGQGICIEPNIAFEKMHRRFRPRDKFVCSAVSDSKNPEIFFTNTGSVTDAYASVTGNFDANSKDTIKVKNLHINDALALVDTVNIDLLSIDTETMDSKIIQAIDFEKFSISTICVETNKSEEDKKNITAVLQDKGYSVFASNPINTIFQSIDNRHNNK